MDPADITDAAIVGEVNTAVYPELHTFRAGFRYELTIAVTGSNFTATFYTGSVLITAEGTAVRAEWTKPVARTRARSS
jgi:hypothetical protein